MMCGVAGFMNFNNEPASPSLLKKMTDSVAHRGPDGEGQWIDGAVGVGHRRLSIIDLSPAGHQPMQTSDGRFILSYNGEVYNFRQLRSRLEAQGIQFRSDTDSEVVLKALATWGHGALAMFNGMFALALWDTQEEKLLLARDRYGIKPMYFASQGNRFWFASENKAMTEDPTFVRNLNLPALFEYMTFQNFYSHQTLLQDVSLLPAGHYMTVSLRDREIKTRIYWDFNFEEPENAADVREYEEELNRLLKQAVKRQLVSDVEVGTYLSGGIDSGAITAIAAQEIPNLKSFTIGFDLSSASGIELGFDERAIAEAMSAVFRTEHYEMVLKAGDMERCLPDLVSALEEPRVGQSYPNFYAAKLASRFVKVVLSGAGGDELFGGYPWRYSKVVHSASFEEFVDSYYLYWQRLGSRSEVEELFAPVWAEVQHVRTRDLFRKVLREPGNEVQSRQEYINHCLYFDAKTFLHGLLVVEDKLSMAHGLETRVPFLDNDLVDFAQKVPVDLKVKNLDKGILFDENDVGNKSREEIRRSNHGKYILRRAASQLVPGKVSSMKKQGFSSPDASWFKGESLGFIRRTFWGESTSLNSVFSRDAIRGMSGVHLEGTRNRRLLIWSLLNLEFWIKRFLNS